MTKNPTDRLDAATLLVMGKVAEAPDISAAVAQLAKDYIALLALIRVWQTRIPALEVAYRQLSSGYPGVSEEIEKYIIIGLECFNERKDQGLSHL